MINIVLVQPPVIRQHWGLTLQKYAITSVKTDKNRASKLCKSCIERFA